MAGNHPKKPDPRPKRRKLKDNPYTIFSVGICTDNPTFFLSFADEGNHSHCIKIDKTLFDAFDEFELDDLSYLNEVDRHHELSEQSEESLNKRAAQHQNSVEELVYKHIEAEALHKAIVQLPEVQRRRLVLYYFGSFTYEQIAEMEGCTHTAVRKSVLAALKKLKNILTDGVSI